MSRILCNWVDVNFNGQVWHVAPTYIYPVSIGAAKRLADYYNCELPSPELVTAIWQQADLKLQPLPRKSDGTPATMASEAVYADQDRRIKAQIGNTEYTLLAGSHKDVIQDAKGDIGLYGWHRPDGTVIQPPYFKHALAWEDYSQGLRLCWRL